MHLWNLPAISIAPDTIFYLFGFPVTNTLLCTWISILILVVLLFIGTRRRDLIPSGMQNALEWIIEAFLGLIESVSGKAKGMKFFPLVASIFFFALIANLLDVLPGVDTVGAINAPLTQAPIWGFLLFGADSNKITPWIRPATTDLNVTLAMAIVSVVVTQIFSFQALGAGEQISKYLNFKALFSGGLGIVNFVVGLLEIFSELARVISFSFRLFGNIFGGSVLLAVFAFLLPVVANIIFIPFEIFVAAIQAFVFAFLTLIFMEVGTTSHAAHAESEHQALEEFEENKAAAAH